MLAHITNKVVFITNMTLSIPEELHKKMQKHSEFKWSEVARRAFEEKINDTILIEDLKSISRAEKEHKAGKTTSHSELLKELGL